MKRFPFVIAAAAAAIAVPGGCGRFDADAGRPAPADAAGPSPEPSTSAVSGLGAAGGPGGALPDPCHLLSRAEVTGLTGRPVTEVDGDGARADDSTRYCQWQQNGGQLALFLSRTTVDEFEAGVSRARPVAGVPGHDAYELAGHLYVRDGTVQVDVYSRGGDRERGDEVAVLRTVLPRLAH